jgi:hypothetical protein
MDVLRNLLDDSDLEKAPSLFDSPVKQTADAAVDSAVNASAAAVPAVV